MYKRWPFLLLVFLTEFLTSCTNTHIPHSSIRTVNPIQYGLNEAKTGVERYYVLQQTHKEAERLRTGVSYKGIKELQMEIPSNAQSIPLTHYTDFAGVTFQVENKQKDFPLFSLSSELIPVAIDGKEIDSRNFSQNQILSSGTKLLVIKDETAWVENRIGYDYGATRKDIMLIKNGKSGNGPVQSYCTASSSPKGSYCDAAVTAKKVIKNIRFNRASTSTKKTYFVKIENQYNVELSNITINTPEGSELYADKAIGITNCINVFIADVTINGTYSLLEKSEDSMDGDTFTMLARCRYRLIINSVGYFRFSRYIKRATTPYFCQWPTL